MYSKTADVSFSSVSPRGLTTVCAGMNGVEGVISGRISGIGVRGTGVTTKLNLSTWSFLSSLMVARELFIIPLTRYGLYS